MPPKVFGGGSEPVMESELRAVCSTSSRISVFSVDAADDDDEVDSLAGGAEKRMDDSSGRIKHVDDAVR